MNVFDEPSYYFLQQDTIKWIYNNSESALEENQKSNQKPTLDENGDGFEGKVEGDHTQAYSQSTLQSPIWNNTLWSTVFVNVTHACPPRHTYAHSYRMRRCSETGSSGLR